MAVPKWLVPKNWWHWEAGTALFLATAYIFHVLDEWYYTLLGALCTLVAVLLPVRQTVKANRLVAAARAEEKDRLCSILLPLARELAFLASKSHADPGGVKRNLKQLVAHTVAPRLGADVRLAFFKYELAPRRLVFDAVSHGRNGHPTIEFRRNKKRGRTVLELMHDPNEPPVFISNVRNLSSEENVEAHSDWANEKQYSSFVAASIWRLEPSKSKLHGMITLDSPNQGTLNKEDAQILVVISHLVAAGFQAAER